MNTVIQAKALAGADPKPPARILERLEADVARQAIVVISNSPILGV
jgi:hypothetical protein